MYPSLVIALALSLVACGEPAVQVPAATVHPQGLIDVSPSRAARPLVPDLASCNIESLDGVGFDGKPREAIRKPGTVSGWLYSKHSDGTDIKASLRLIDMATARAWEREITNWRPRPDVLAAFGHDYGALPGFDQPVDLSALHPGTYRIILVFADGGTMYACDNGREVRLQ